jgi:hypothetical protein
MLHLEGNEGSPMVQDEKDFMEESFSMSSGSKKPLKKFRLSDSREIQRRWFILFLVGLFAWTILVIMNDAQPLAASAQSTATLNLQTQITVQPRVSTIHVDHTGRGQFQVTAEFLVESNTNQAEMFVEATDFYFGGDPRVTEVATIPLVSSAGVDIDPLGANPVNASNRVNYVGKGDLLDGLPSQKTQTVLFRSTEKYSFSHPVSVTVRWNQNDPLKPAGQYIAKIRLNCLAMPAGF